jgi:branched-chain amino acid transport system ATP-binding protein
MNDINILIAKSLIKNFGGVSAISDVSFAIKKGQVFSIIGPNGAGKTTLLNMLTGVYKIDSGTIHFNGAEISKFPPYKISNLGINRTFQNLQIFKNMSVLENVMVGCYNKGTSGLISSLFYLPNVWKEEKQIRQWAIEALDFCGLSSLIKKDAAVLPYGDLKRIEIARSLASDPTLLLLDEPAAGLNDKETMELLPLIKKIRDTGITVGLVEHHMGLVMEVSDAVLVLNFGSKLAEGNPLEIQRNKDVIAAYLGG